jgi:hypothetical protein
MSSMQEYDEDCTGQYALCNEAIVPGVDEHEYCSENVHKQKRYYRTLIWNMSIR